MNSSKTVSLRETNYGSVFSDSDQTISWNTTLGLEGLTTGEVLSPASVLVHELNHFNLWAVDEGITLGIYNETPIEGFKSYIYEYEAVEAGTKSNNGVTVRNDYEDANPIVTEGPLSKTKVKDFTPPVSPIKTAIEDEIKKTK